MPKQTRNRSAKNTTIVILVVAAVAVVVGFWLLQIQDAPDGDPGLAAVPDKVSVPVKDRPVIDYGNLKKDEALQTEMQKRMAEYGIEKSLDMIVKPGESVKIGGLTVPMAEILEKVRLGKGDLIEGDLASAADREAIRKERKARIGELIASENRYNELTSLLGEPAGSKPETDREALAAEHARLGETVALFKRYQETIKALTDTRRQMAEGNAEARESARTTLHTLKQQIEKLERLLGIPRIPEKNVELYGIYVVRAGDNIWNIHFRFLKEYFAHRDVALSPVSDEPDQRGFSSGVGRILKFSENMVYIYNLKENRLDVDLNLLQPLSKIVIFNMGEVFAMLDPIDYGKVNRIRFDGETLWIPAQ